MNEKVLKQIILVHPIPFAGKVIQEFLADELVQTYILEDGEFEDFDYLLSDLSPEIFLVHELVYTKYKEIFDKQLAKYPMINKGIILTEVDGDRSDLKDGAWEIVISSPYDPANLYSDLINQLVK